LLFASLGTAYTESNTRPRTHKGIDRNHAGTCQRA
jgi:hypothetical protein